MYNVTIFCEPENIVVREVTCLQFGEMQTAFIRLGIKHNAEEIRPTPRAADGYKAMACPECGQPVYLRLFSLDGKRTRR